MAKTLFSYKIEEKIGIANNKNIVNHRFKKWS